MTEGTLGRRVVVLLIALSAVLAFGFAVANRPSPSPMVPVISDPGMASVPATEGYTVHVAGAVRRPGLVVVSAGSRVADAIAAAGGASRSADLSGINLAAPIDDAMFLLVPDTNATAGAAEISPQPTDSRIDVNRAGVSELTQLPGVGVVLAARIISYREANGPFSTVDDLLDVSGIGEGKLAVIRELSVAR